MPNLDVAIDARKAKAGANQFDDSARKVKRGAKGIDTDVKKSDKSLSSFGKTASRAAAGLVTLAAAYKGLRFAQTAIKDAVAFEMELANVSTMLDDQTMRYLPQYEGELSRLAVKYGQATGTLSKGLYDVLSASIDAGDAIGVVEIASKAAIAGLTDTGTAADALTTILNAYGFEAKDATKVSDILFATVKRGKITFGELAGSIGKVVALAAAAGLSFEQMSAAIATMTRSGIQADMAMTALKGIITTFLSPQREGIEVAKKFGLELNANTLQTIGLTGALEKLKSATSEETATIFGNVRALLGAEATRKSLSALIEDYEGILKSAGSTEKAYQKIAQTTQHELRQFSEIWKQIKRDIGKGIQPELDAWMTGFRPLVNEWINGWRAMASEQNKAQELIDQKMGEAAWLRLIPNFYLLEKLWWKVNGTSLEAELAMLKADEAMNQLSISSHQLADGLKAIDEMDIEVAPIDLGAVPDLRNIKKYTKEQKEAGIAVADLFKELRVEKELIGKTTEERERAIKVMEFEKVAKAMGTQHTEELVKMYDAEVKSLQKVYMEAEKAAQFEAKIYEGMEGLIRSPLTALLDETRDIGEVIEDELRSLGTSILESMYEELITTPLKESLMKALNPVFDAATSMLSELLSGVMGGVASGIGGIIGMAIPGLFAGGGAAAAPTMSAFAGVIGEKGLVVDRKFGKGDILNGPTIFPMSNGGVGLAGEAGKEAIMPLGRDTAGRLGVRTEGGGDKQTIKIINVRDQSEVQEYISSGDGERQIVNIMRRNSSEISV